MILTAFKWELISESSVWSVSTKSKKRRLPPKIDLNRKIYVYSMASFSASRLIASIKLLPHHWIDHQATLSTYLKSNKKPFTMYFQWHENHLWYDKWQFLFRCDKRIVSMRSLHFRNIEKYVPNNEHWVQVFVLYFTFFGSDNIFP